ncbi:MAG: hypothetical protein GC165_01520 [Armatimonadetes bacterium]|nr:hypothetical protein [Armatimonadota bacterium]
MRVSRTAKVVAPLVVTALLAPFAVAQIGQLVKLVGIWEVTKRYGNDINKAFNKLVKRDEASARLTKVVPIISGGVGSRKAVGMVQVSGPKRYLDTVKSVAQLDQDLFGKEVKIRAMVPIDQDTIGKTITPVPEVGITGIVDFKL